MAPDRALHREQVTDVRRAVSAEVNDPAETLGSERPERARVGPVAGHLADATRPEARPRATVEWHHLVAVVEEQLDGSDAHEARPADHEHSHRPGVFSLI